MSLTVTLFSNEEGLIRAFRDIVAATFGGEWSLNIGTPGQLPAGDVPCIWDFRPAQTPLLRELKPAELRRHWFLLNPAELGELCESMGTSDLNILLKPISRSTLQAFLGGVTQQMASGGSIDELRNALGQLLQYLIQANHKLQEYDQERNDFLSCSAFEFRAPLTAMSGYCDLLMEEALGSLTSEQREVLVRMQNCAARMSRISNAMSQLSTSCGGDHALCRDNSDIRGCIEQALQQIGAEIESKQLSVSLDIEPAPSSLLFAAPQMEQAVVSLLENSCKFAPRGSTIEIKGYRYFWERRVKQASPLEPRFDRRLKQLEAANSFRIDVIDSGPRVPVDSINKAFEPYASGTGNPNRAGGGLGLAICRTIVQQHHGCVWAACQPNEPVFSIVLPLTYIDEIPDFTEDGEMGVEIGMVRT